MKNDVWDSDGIRISGNMTVEAVGQEVWIVGTANKACKMYQWAAKSNPQGWQISVKRQSNDYLESFQGSTHNLPLEIASAIKRSL